MSNFGLQKKAGSKHPYLSGNFAPVSVTHSSTPCAFTGRIPRELYGGQFVRNGGNPIKPNLGRDAHWFDGDGMVAGVLFQRSCSEPNGVVPYFSNQYVLTDLAIFGSQNKAIRTPILPSIATLVDPTSSLLQIAYRTVRSVFLVLLSRLSGYQAIKRISVANTGIYFHDGRALATCESGPPVRIQLPGLETIGWFNGQYAEGEPISVDSHTEIPGFGGTGPLSFMREWTTGHPKVDPRTGELFLFHCNFMAVQYSVIPSTKYGQKLLNTPIPGCSGGKMMHDFGVSSGHAVILDLPLTLTPVNLLKNRPFVSYDEDLPARFGVFPRTDPSEVKWFETSGCCIFHTANTWDDDGPVVNMLVCRHISASLLFNTGNLIVPSRPIIPKQKVPHHDFVNAAPDEKAPRLKPTSTTLDKPCFKNHYHPSQEEEQCRLYFYRFSLSEPENRITDQFALSAVPFEFPTLNPAYEMSAARYIYGCSTSRTTFGAALGKATKVDVLIKMDVQTLLKRSEAEPPTSITGCVDTRTTSEVLASNDPDDPICAFKMPPNHYAQEARFVSRERPGSEDDGFLIFYAFDESQLDEDGECLPGAISELFVIDAKNMSDVIARVRLPQRVPYGFHGNWFKEEQIESQRGVNKVRTVPITRNEGWGRKVTDALLWMLG